MTFEELKSYFETAQGTGVLSTCNSAGNVNSALYSRPNFMEDGSIAFIMNDRRSYSNIKENPKAAYLFVEEGSKSKGVRLYLKKEKETDDKELISKIKRHHSESVNDEDKKRFLVYFSLEDSRDLVEKV